jgi:hypothetical protein
MNQKRTFKVTKTIGGAQSYRQWADYSEGDIVIGTYQGIHICQFKKENYKVKVLDAQFKDDPDLATSLIDKTLVLNENGSLKKQMTESGIKEGDLFQVEYTGKYMITKGPFAGKEGHGVSVSLLEEDTTTSEDAVNGL